MWCCYGTVRCAVALFLILLLRLLLTSSRRNIENNVSTKPSGNRLGQSDLEDLKLSVASQNCSLSGGLESSSLDKELEVEEVTGDVGLGVTDDPEEDLGLGGGEEDFERALKKHMDNLYKLVPGYRQWEEKLGKQYTISPAGAVLDPETKANLEEHKSRQTYAYTAKPGTYNGTFVIEEHEEIVSLHNLYRSNYTYPSGNTEYMQFSQELVDIADRMVQQCIYKDLRIQDGYKWPLGYNIYIGPLDRAPDILREWYSEKKHFDFLKWKCRRKECGHVTQMLWATTKYVGCQRHYCWPGETDITYVLCLYFPPGNLISKERKAPVRGYIIAKPCSKCPFETGGYCLDNKCVSREFCEEKTKEPCPCSLECQNCATRSDENCTCSCKEGWDHLDCALPCKDEYENCQYIAYSSCPDTGYGGVQECREKCDFCSPVNSVTNTSICCDGVICPSGAVLNAKICACQPYCPHITCYPDEPTDSSSSRNLIIRNYVLGLLLLTVGSFL